MVYQAMADTLIRLGTRLEVRGIALEAFAKDERKKNSGLQDGVSAIRVAGRRAVIGAKGVRGIPKAGILAQHVLPGVTPGLTRPAPDGVVNLTEFVFLVPDAAQQRALNP
jgi:hypothetical protein